MPARKKDRGASALRKRFRAHLQKPLTDERVRELYQRSQEDARARVRREMAKLNRLVDEIVSGGGEP